MVCPTKVLSKMRLSEGNLFKTCANPQTAFLGKSRETALLPAVPPSSAPFPGTLPSTLPGTFGDWGFLSAVEGDLDSKTGFFLGGELAGRIIADPIAEYNHKRTNTNIYRYVKTNIYIYAYLDLFIHMEMIDQNTRREGIKLPNIHILSLSCRTGSSTTGSTRL